ncbi:MAG: endonuclease MutS2 [Ignavibacteriaceae bacterium]|nr:endonuclease MutS2 [Ignavibacteriaceae bacterium]
MIEQSVLDKLEFPKLLQIIAKYTVSAPGKRSVMELLPRTVANEIRAEGILVSEAKELLITAPDHPLDYFPELAEDIALSRIEGSILPSQKILNINKLASISRLVIHYLNTNRDTAPALVAEVNDSLYNNRVLENHINSILTESGELKDNASRELQHLRRAISEKRAEIEKVTLRIMKDLMANDIMREEYITLRDGRIVLPVKVEYKRQIKGFIHSESATGQTVYIEPEQTLNMNNELISYYFAEKREIERILREVTRKIGEESEKLLRSFYALVRIDSIFARAKYSLEYECSFPEIEGQKLFNIRNGRHPLLLNKLGKNSTVALNLEADENQVILITGPNAGGKTVVLKTVGLLVAMVQTGIHIPADPDSGFLTFGSIKVDIGDQQSIEDDLSTFSSHLMNIKGILNNAGQRTLVLIDEIGTGTDPEAGAAIASAALVELKQKGALTLATTHHTSLKILAGKMEGFENASMQFDTKELKPTFILRQGIPGSSYAFEIAQRIGYSEGFLRSAEGFMQKKNIDIENMLLEIEEQGSRLRDEINRTNIENSRLSASAVMYEEKLKRLEKEKKDILRKASERAEELFLSVKKQTEELIKEIRNSSASKESIKEYREGMARIEKDLKTVKKQSVKEESPVSEYSPRVGDTVKIKMSQSAGVISELIESKKNAIVQIGALKFTVPYNELEPTSSAAVKKSGAVHYQETGNMNYRLDIRGQKPEDIELEILKFIDNGYSSSLDRVEILHGKGTGVLKKLVKELLTSHKAVKKFYFAPVDFGGDGITIVELN